MGNHFVLVWGAARVAVYSEGTERNMGGNEEWRDLVGFDAISALFVDFIRRAIDSKSNGKCINKYHSSHSIYIILITLTIVCLSLLFILFCAFF